MHPGERRPGQRQRTHGIDEAQAVAGGLDGPVPVSREQRRATALREFRDHVQNLGRLRARHHRDARLDDPGFLGRDAGEAVAEEFPVVDRDRGDGAGSRPLDHVGRVTPAAEPDLQDAEISRILGEEQEGGGGDDLEHGDRRAGVDPLHCFQCIRERRRLHEPVGQADALVEIDQMR